jgi:hypothetical protein
VEEIFVSIETLTIFIAQSRHNSIIGKLFGWAALDEEQCVEETVERSIGMVETAERSKERSVDGEEKIRSFVEEINEMKRTRENNE